MALAVKAGLLGAAEPSGSAKVRLALSVHASALGVAVFSLTAGRRPVHGQTRVHGKDVILVILVEVVHGDAHRTAHVKVEPVRILHLPKIDTAEAPPPNDDHGVPAVFTIGILKPLVAPVAVLLVREDSAAVIPAATLAVPRTLR